MTELAAKGSVTQKLVDETLSQLQAANAAGQEADANVKSAEAMLRAAKANVQKSQADLAAAGARQRVAEANLSRAKTMLAYADIKAPFNGVVTQRNVDTGHYVHPVTGASTEPLLMIAQMEKVRVFVDVPEMEAPLVDSGDKPDSAVVRVQSLGETGIDGKVTERAGRWTNRTDHCALKSTCQMPMGNCGPECTRKSIYCWISVTMSLRYR